MASKILVLDFGSQYTMLIARRIRELRVYCEIHPYNISVNTIEDFNPDGIILSGGPSSVFREGFVPRIKKEIFELGIPVLGICYGMQLITHMFGGKVAPAGKREYGVSRITPCSTSLLFKNFIWDSNPNGPRFIMNSINSSIPNKVWMSHGDEVEVLPEGFAIIAMSDNSIAAIENTEKQIYGIQFHPEVVHTPCGTAIINNFLFNICHTSADWTPLSFIESSVEQIRKKVGGSKVILGLSGGVDSTVAAKLIRKAIGDQLVCIFIDNGFLRLNEVDEVLKTNPNTIHINASERFLKAIQDVENPEFKRKIIGKVFIDVFEEASVELKILHDVKFLAQGTLYPDVIESQSSKGPSAVIKTHHNVGGLPERMKFKLLEPFRELFKDEVRMIGRELGVPEEIVNRQPFPGPGLAVRILGNITEERLQTLREADAIVRSEIQKYDVEHNVWQYFAVLLPVNTVGVVGDERTYGNIIAIRAIESQDGMTADWYRLPYDLLQQMSTRITNEVKGVNRVVYDISSKPPATIEWL